MTQSYRIHMGHGVVTLTHQPDIRGQVVNVIDDGTFQMKQFAATHFQRTDPFEINVICADVALTWPRFCSAFKVIEAAGGVVLDTDRRVLMIHRLGHWDLPKGKLETGETPEIAALREVEEECGVAQLVLNRTLPASYHVYEDKGRLILKKTHWYLMGTTHNGPLVPQTEEQIRQAVWADAKMRSRIISEAYPAIQELLYEVFPLMRPE